MKTLNKFIGGMVLVFALTLLITGSGTALAQGEEGLSQAGRNTRGIRFKTISVLPRPPTRDSLGPIAFRSQTDPMEFDGLKASAPTADAPYAESVIDSEIDHSQNAPQSPSAPSLSTNFKGFNATGWIPPDPTLSAGPSHIVAAVNESWSIFDKSGTNLYNNTLASWFSNVLPDGSNGFSVFDPHTVYDSLGGRFILIAGAVRSSDQRSFIVISVSNTNNAMGNWCNWATDFELNGVTLANILVDYPQVGVNNEAVYLTANMYGWTTGFKYAKMRIISKSVLYDTSCPGFGWWDFWKFSGANGKVFTWLPAITMDSSRAEYLLDSASASSNLLTLWKVNDPLGTPTLTQWAISVASYLLPPDAQQKGSSTLLSTGDARLLNAVVVGNRAWTTHSTACRFPGESVNRSCLRYYQINLKTRAVLNTATWGASGKYYFYPAIMANTSQNAVIVFSRAASNEYGNTRYTGRKSTDSVNSLQSSASLKAGSNKYVQFDTIGRNRWGDFGGIGLDPSDNCFWMHHEYATATANTWGTWIGRTCLQ